MENGWKSARQPLCLRLLVFSRALTDLLSEPARLPQRRQELATTVVRGILASDLRPGAVFIDFSMDFP